MAKRNGGTSARGKKSTSMQKRDTKDLGEQIAATPFSLMRRFGEEMDRLFGDFGRDWLSPVAGNLPRGLWAPQVEMFDRDNEFVIRADLPGLDKEDVKVEMADEGITIEGERRNEHEEEREGFYRSERSYGKFYRRLPLPDGVTTKGANATFNNGVLEITMPTAKRTESQRHRLEIKDQSAPQAKRKAA